MNDALSKTFDVPSTKEVVDYIDADTGEVVSTPESKIESDYDLGRENMRSLLLSGQEALTAALSVAKQSEHPRAFEVVGNLIKQLADVNQQLLSLHQQKQKIDAPTKGSEPKNTNNTAIFVGSTAELNKMLKNMTTGD
jgi:hypothetical protein